MMKIIKSSIECSVDDRRPTYAQYTAYRVSFVLGLGARGVAHEVVSVEAKNVHDAVVIAIKARVSPMYVSEDVWQYIDENF